MEKKRARQREKRRLSREAGESTLIQYRPEEIWFRSPPDRPAGLSLRKLPTTLRCCLATWAISPLSNKARGRQSRVLRCWRWSGGVGGGRRGREGGVGGGDQWRRRIRGSPPFDQSLAKNREGAGRGGTQSPNWSAQSPSIRRSLDLLVHSFVQWHGGPRSR